jgi:hypothetical protein
MAASYFYVFFFLWPNLLLTFSAEKNNNSLVLKFFLDVEATCFNFSLQVFSTNDFFSPRHAQTKRSGQPVLFLLQDPNLIDETA